MTKGGMKNRANLARMAILMLGTMPSLLGAAEDAKKIVRMVVTQAYVSKAGMPVYEEMAQYFSKKTGFDVKIVTGLGYDEADKLLAAGKIDVGYICGLPYVQNVSKDIYEMLAMPVLGLEAGTYNDAPGYSDKPGKYFSYTIVRKDSPYKTWADLKGKTYAFNSLTSNSGYNMPRNKLIELGATSWEGYFSKVIKSGGHQESIRLVAQGVVEASSVESLVLDYDRKIGEANALNVRIIEAFPDKGAGAPPIVISRKSDPEVKAKLKDVILHMHEDTEGQAVLKTAMLKRFIPPDDRNYDDIRDMIKHANAVNFSDWGGVPAAR
ncbi:MAG: PhnD/SsuA/transferrin family substrate-binding protein [Pseudomonadota bacterium]